MFLVNTKKCLQVFDDVYVSSDDKQILLLAQEAGARPIWRDEDLCGDVPNIPVYQHALKEMGHVGGIVAVQACSPTVDIELIRTAKVLMEQGYDEVMTCHPVTRALTYHEQHFNIYGSIWAISTRRLKVYPDPYRPNPQILLVDESKDVHNMDDYKQALRDAQS